MTKEWTNKWNETQNILKVRTVKRCHNLTVLASVDKLFPFSVKCGSCVLCLGWDSGLILKEQKRELLVIKAVCLETVLILKAFTLTCGVFSIFDSTYVKFCLIFKGSHFVFLLFVKLNIKAMCLKKCEMDSQWEFDV